jgi:hypothetical protein
MNVWDKVIVCAPNVDRFRRPDVAQPLDRTLALLNQSAVHVYHF